MLFLFHGLVGCLGGSTKVFLDGGFFYGFLMVLETGFDGCFWNQRGSFLQMLCQATLPW